jgi:cyclic pyranopterin phosphate synthase
MGTLSMRLPIVDILRVAAPAIPGLDTGPRSIGAVRVLRISVTDRCNFRCVYCMPEEGVRWLPKEGILSFEEIADIVRAAIGEHGIRRFKLTGGEPTIRHGIVDLVRMLRAIDGIDDLSLTTNGMLLESLAGPLREAGLDRVTVSIDSLSADRFRAITRTGDLASVLRGLDRCEAVGFGGLKINCVTMRGTNDDEVADFARLTLNRRLTVRFIEYMPLGDAALMHVGEKDEGGRMKDEKDASSPVHPSSFILHPSASSLILHPSEFGPAGGCGAQDRGADAFIAEDEVRRRIEGKLGPLVPVARDTEPGVGPANVYRLAEQDPAGRIGFISAMSAPFCATCNRLRLTADGVLRSCLFEGGEVDVRSILRSEQAASDRGRALAQAMTDCVRLKPDVHSGHGNRQMSQMGG